MSFPKKSVLSWDIDSLTAAMKLDASEVRQYFTDGRRASFLLERRISREIVQGTIAKSEGAGYDVIDPAGGKWEVRSLTRRGTYFCPSYMVGKNRKFELQGFLDKLDEVEGYIISDIELFPNIPVWVVSADEVLTWWNENKLQADSKITRAKAHQLFAF